MATLPVVDELIVLLQESADYHGKFPELARMLTRALHPLKRLRKRVMTADRGWVLAVVGLTNVGKSTLMNALLGEEVAPQGNYPCTAIPVEYRFGAQRQITQYPRDSFRRPFEAFESAASLARSLALLVDERNIRRTAESLEKVVVTAPLALLRDGLCLVDTPGFGAAQIDEAQGTHEKVLQAYLAQHVSQIFWVVRADAMPGAREFAFHGTHLQEACDDLIITNAEDFDAEDRRRWVQKVTGQFMDQQPRFHFVSGLDGVRGRKAQDASQLEKAGITALEQRIRNLATADGRSQETVAAIRDLVSDLCTWLIENTPHSPAQPGHSMWRPDSFWRFKAAAGKHAWTEPVMASLLSVEKKAH